MIIEIYLILATAALACIAIGFWRDYPLIKIAGYLLLFFVGLIMAGIPIAGIGADGIEYKTGADVTTLGSTQTITYTYATYTTHTYGYMIAMLGFLLLLAQLFDPKVRYS